MNVVPVYNPPVPYRGALPMAAGHGSSIIINGTVPNGCNRFVINLMADNKDVALHFNPRFEGVNAVIRNTRQQGSWGNEERHGHFPFQQGQAFEVMFLIDEQHYKVAINGSHFCEYGHRIPKEMVRQLKVKGDVQLTQIRFQGLIFPGQMGNQPQGQYGHPNPPAPTMPVSQYIPGGMQPGKMIRISGQPIKNPSRFNVNLVNGTGFHSNADIGMHCDVRFNYGDDSKVVVRNDRENGGWGQEERHSPFFPFVPGQAWEMIIRAEQDKYMVAVNNQHMYEFKHRQHPLHRFDHLVIEGDITVRHIQFQ